MDGGIALAFGIVQPEQPRLSSLSEDYFSSLRICFLFSSCSAVKLSMPAMGIAG